MFSKKLIYVFGDLGNFIIILKSLQFKEPVGKTFKQSERCARFSEENRLLEGQLTEKRLAALLHYF